MTDNRILDAGHVQRLMVRSECVALGKSHEALRAALDTAERERDAARRELAEDYDGLKATLNAEDIPEAPILTPNELMIRCASMLVDHPDIPMKRRAEARDAVVWSHENLRDERDAAIADRAMDRENAAAALSRVEAAEARVGALEAALRRIVNETVPNDQFGYAITIAAAALGDAGVPE